MPLIVAIEPDGRQAAQLLKLARGSLNAKLVVTESAAQALGAFNEGIPDLILTSPRLSKKDEKALADRLKALDKEAAHVQRLTIPLLGASGPARGKRHVSRVKRASDSLVEGCDPELFAERIAEYLELAAAERALLDAGTRRGSATPTGPASTAPLASPAPIEAPVGPPAAPAAPSVPHEAPSIGRMLDEMVSRAPASARQAAPKNPAKPLPSDLSATIEQVLGPDAVEPIALEPIALDAETLECLGLGPETNIFEKEPAAPAALQVSSSGEGTHAVELGDIGSLDLSAYVHQLEATEHVGTARIELVSEAAEVAPNAAPTAASEAARGESFEVGEFDRSVLFRYGEEHPNDFVSPATEFVEPGTGPNAESPHEIRTEVFEMGSFDPSQLAGLEVDAAIESGSGAMALAPAAVQPLNTADELEPATAEYVAADAGPPAAEPVLESMTPPSPARGAEWAGVLTPIAWSAAPETTPPESRTAPEASASASDSAGPERTDVATAEGRRRGPLFSRFQDWLSAHRQRTRPEPEPLQPVSDSASLASGSVEPLRPETAAPDPTETVTAQPALASAVATESPVEDLAPLFDAIEGTKEAAVEWPAASKPVEPLLHAVDMAAPKAPPVAEAPNVQPMALSEPASPAESAIPEAVAVVKPTGISESAPIAERAGLEPGESVTEPTILTEPAAALPAEEVVAPEMTVNVSPVVDLAPALDASADAPSTFDPAPAFEPELVVEDMTAIEWMLAAFEAVEEFAPEPPESVAAPVAVADATAAIEQPASIEERPIAIAAPNFFGLLRPATVTAMEIVVGEPWAIDSAVEETDDWIASPFAGHTWPRLDWFGPDKPKHPSADEEPLAAGISIADVQIARQPVEKKVRIRKKAAKEPLAASNPPKADRPIQDEWGMFDPDKCGIAAVLAKLGLDDVPTTTSKRRPRNRRH